MDTKDTKNHKGTRRLSVCFYHKALKGAQGTQRGLATWQIN